MTGAFWLELQQLADLVSTALAIPASTNPPSIPAANGGVKRSASFVAPSVEAKIEPTTSSTASPVDQAAVEAPIVVGKSLLKRMKTEA